MKTNYLFVYIFAIAAGGIFSSCTKIITLDLKNSDPLYVIEGEVNKGELIHSVNITKSVKFSEVNNFPTVSGALVVLSDNAGNSVVLSEVSPGKYSSSSILGVEGRTYTLSVKINGQEFIATSTIPKQVNLDYLYFLEGGFGGAGEKVPVPIRQDPAGIANFYRFNMSVSRFKDNKGWLNDSTILIQDDAFSDGLISQQPLFGSLGFFMPNDTCKLTMMCVDKNVYKYFYSLSLNSPNGAATPANPVSNFSGGCLGYFTAQTKQTVTVIVP